MKSKELILGVVYAPFLKELFTAEKNKGAFRNGQKIKVSDIKGLDKAYLLSCEGSEKTNRRVSEINQQFHRQVKDLRKLGSAALESCWVACGRADVYLVPKIESWDVAAGALIVKEAGGKVTNFKGKPWNYKTSDLVFSNGKIHDIILKQMF